MKDFDYREIVSEMEHNLLRFGDTHQGVGWTRDKAHVDLRYQVMLEGIRAQWPRPLTVLDFGCGAAHFHEYMQANAIPGVTYTGLDLSQMYLQLCRRKFPDLEFIDTDILDLDARVPSFDFVAMNGILHYKGEQSHEQMWAYAQRLLQRVDSISKRGFAFNAMTDHVDWQREDLFHLPLATITEFIGRSISRNFTVRHDYGLYEYTVHVYKEPLSVQV